VLQNESTRKSAIVRRALRETTEAQDLLRRRFNLNQRPLHARDILHCRNLQACSVQTTNAFSSTRFRSSWCIAAQVRDKTEPSRRTLSFPSNSKSLHALNHRQFYSQWASVRQHGGDHQSLIPGKIPVTPTQVRGREIPVTMMHPRCK